MKARLKSSKLRRGLLEAVRASAAGKTNAGPCAARSQDFLYGDEGVDNVLADLGFEDAEELSAKAVLAVKLNELIDKRGLSQMEAARITGMTQPKVSQVRRYKLQNISLERLMQALVTLDQHVEIVVRPARRAHGAGITVAG